jgi:GTP pyrophosphokinase
LKVGRGTIEKLRERLVSSLAEAGIEVEINFRVKRYYSIYQKLRRQQIDISELYDYLAFRIVTTNLRDTYGALGTVHQSFRPIPGRFKDYIAMPKPNLYQSLHTTVLGPAGQPFEVQIRTREMDLVAEEGIAAHWRYKEGKLSSEGVDKSVLAAPAPRVQTDVSDPRHFLSGLKLDLYQDEVYVFSPKGDVLAFPRDAMPLDFAYRIHTDLGHRCTGARVNGRLVPLRTQLKTGDIVEILTSPSRVPSRDWLSLVVTSRAKHKIRHWLNTQQTAQATDLGQRMLDRGLRRYRLSPKKVLESPDFRKLMDAQGSSRPEDLYGRLGYGKSTVAQVMAFLLPQEKLRRAAQRRGTRKAIDRVLTGGARDRSSCTAMATFSPYPPSAADRCRATRSSATSRADAACRCTRRLSERENLLYNAERRSRSPGRARRKGLYPISLLIETEDNRGCSPKLTEAIAASTPISARSRPTPRQAAAPSKSSSRFPIAPTSSAFGRAVRNLPGVLEVTRRMAGSAKAGEDAF